MELSNGNGVISSSLTSEVSTTKVQFFNKITDVNRLTIEWFIEHNAVCSICKEGINSYDINNLKLHSRLKVIICVRCSAQDDSNIRPEVNACNWCGRDVTAQPNLGGRAFQTCCIPECSNKLCWACLSSNFSKPQVEKMQTGWECFDCNPQTIKPHQLYAEYLMEFALRFKQPLIPTRSIVSSSANSNTRADFISEIRSLLVQLESQPNKDDLSDDTLSQHIKLTEKLRTELSALRNVSSSSQPVPEVSKKEPESPTIPLRVAAAAESPVPKPVPEAVDIYIKPEAIEGVIDNSNVELPEKPVGRIYSAVKSEPEAIPPIRIKKVDPFAADSKQTVELGLEQKIQQPSRSPTSKMSDVNHLLGDLNRRYVSGEKTQLLPSSARGKASVRRKLAQVEKGPFLSSDDEEVATSGEENVQESSSFHQERPLIIVSSDDELLLLNSSSEYEGGVSASEEADINEPSTRLAGSSCANSSSEQDKGGGKHRRNLPSVPLMSSASSGRRKKSKGTSAKKRPFSPSSDEQEERSQNLESATGSESVMSDSAKENSATPEKLARKKPKLYVYSSSGSSDDHSSSDEKKEAAPERFTKQNLETSSAQKCPASVEEETWIISSDNEEFTRPVSQVATEAESSASTGRRNLREMLTEAQLSQATIEANSKERERRKRLEEMQKKYNQFELSVEQNGESVKCVLEYDLNTKKPLVRVHEELSKRMKTHQVEGVKFLYQNIVENLEKMRNNFAGSGAILGHCMGLGKTFQVVCFLHTLMTHSELKKHFKTVLILSPLNVIATWQEEIRCWVDRNSKIVEKLRYYSLHKESVPRLRLAMLTRWQRTGGIMLMTPNLLTSLLGRTTEAGKRARPRPSAEINLVDQFKQNICDPGPQLLIVDEGHMLKRSSTQLTQVVLKIKTKRKILLTGTPLQNNLTEYFTMVSIVSPYLFGTKTEFGNRFQNPIMNGQYKNSTEADIRKMRQRASVLNRLLEKVVHRRDLSVLQEILPPRHDYVISIRLSPIQEVLYETFLKMLIWKAEEARVPSTPTFTRLLQDFVLLRSIWTHPKLLTMPKKTFQKKQAVATVSDMLTFDSITNETSSEDVSKAWYKPHIKGRNLNDVRLGPKIFILFDVIQNCGMIGDKLVVFCTQLSALDLVEVLLRLMNDNGIGEGSWITNKDYFRMDGQTSAEDRHRYFKEFNDASKPRARLFLVSTNAGKLGSTLTGANRMVLLDTSWNPADDNQAVYRIYRIGQRKPVFIYRFVSFGTMEEKIYARNILKESTSCRVLDDSNMERHFTHEDVRDLYTFTPYVESDRVMPSVPKDKMLAELILRHKDYVVKVHEHQQMLQNLEDDLSAEDRRIAWDEYQREKEVPTAEVAVPFAFPMFEDQNLTRKVQNFDVFWARSDVTDRDRLRMASQLRNDTRRHLKDVLRCRESVKQSLSTVLRTQSHGDNMGLLRDLASRMRHYNDAEHCLNALVQKIDYLISRTGQTPIPRLQQPDDFLRAD